jgi:hypothetical protein
MKKLDEKSMSTLERQIPELAEGAAKQAYIKTLASGRRVVEAVGGKLIETRPDGVKKVLKELHSPISVTPGQKILRKKR